MKRFHVGIACTFFGFALALAACPQPNDPTAKGDDSSGGGNGGSSSNNGGSAGSTNNGGSAGSTSNGGSGGGGGTSNGGSAGTSAGGGSAGGGASGGAAGGGASGTAGANGGAAGGSAGAGGGQGGAAGAAALSFATDIYAGILNDANKTCTVHHSSTNGMTSGNLDMKDAMTAYAKLTNSAMNAATTDTCKGMPLVTPGDPTKSVLWKRVSGTSCGDQMPDGKPALSAALQAKIQTWIMGGAKM